MGEEYIVDFQELQSRYSQLYTAVVGDILDQLGYWHQILPGEIQALARGTKIFGEAFTVEGQRALDNSENDNSVRVEMLEQVPGNSIVVMAAQADQGAAHWGEITALAARNNGCLGAVVDGGTRDVEQLLAHSFPTFARFRSPAASTGRWSVKHWQVPVQVGLVTVNPADYILGDLDGIIVIPRNLAARVLGLAEEKVAKEKGMRAALAQGTGIGEVFRKFGHF